MKTKLISATTILIGFISMIVFNSFQSENVNKEYLTLYFSPLANKMIWVDEKGISEVHDYEYSKKDDLSSKLLYDPKNLNEIINKISKRGYELVNSSNEQGVIYYIFEKSK